MSFCAINVNKLNLKCQLQRQGGEICSCAVLCCAVRRNKQSESVDVVASVDKKKEEDPDFMVCKALLNKVVAKKTE